MLAKNHHDLAGAGLGLRRSLMPAMLFSENLHHINMPDFLEIAPENWIGIGGRYAKDLSRLTSELPFVCHGLSLPLGEPAPLDIVLIKKSVIFGSTPSDGVFGALELYR